MRQGPLLERDGEVVAATAAIADVTAGRGRLLVVAGEAGVGKTRLLAHLRRLPAAADLRVFSARGSDLERHFAFGVVRQLFEPEWLAAGGTVSGAARGAAAVFTQGGAAGRDADLAVLHGLYWLTVALCERPALLLVDDAHWADAASLRYLAYLVPRLEDLPLLVVVAVRTGEPATDELLLRHVTGAPEAAVLRPAPLTERATTTLLADALGGPADREFAAACFAATSGNPLLLRALAGTLAADGVAPTAANSGRVLVVGSRAVAHLVSARLAATTQPVRDTAAAVAVLGPGTALPAVAELANLDVVAAQETVDELTRVGLLDAGPPAAPHEVRVSYAHPLMAAAVYDALGARDRAEAHRRAAAILVRLGADAERVGVHLLKTPPGGGDAVVAALRRAAEVARARGSAEAALEFLLRSRAEPLDDRARLELLTAAARVAVQVNLDVAVSLLEEARGLATGGADAAAVAAELSRAYGYLRAPERAAAALYDALDHVPPGDEDGRRRLQASLLVGAFLVPGRLDVARRLPALQALPAHDSLGGLMLQAAIAEHETAGGDRAGPPRARGALADGRLVREANGEGALVCAWLALLAADDPTAMDSLDESVRHAHLYGSVRALAAASCFRALGLLWRGQLAEAERDAREALRLAETGRVDMDPAFAGSYLADALTEQGRLADAEATLRAIGIPGPRSPRPRYTALDAYARLLRAQGRHEAAADAAAEAGELFQAYGFRNPALEGWRTEAALALFALGRVDEARARAREEADLARHWGAPRALGRALRVLGQVTGGAEGLDLLRHAVDTLARGPARLEYAKALLDLGAALRRAGHRTAAREPLSAALDHAELCGSAPISARAHAELRTAGYRPRRNRITGLDALTPGERRVAEAAARGASNREIAQELFVTTKTVEVHLSSAYRKLGVRGRHELGRHLGAGKPRGGG